MIIVSNRYFIFFFVGCVSRRINESKENVDSFDRKKNFRLFSIIGRERQSWEIHLNKTEEEDLSTVSFLEMIERRMTRRRRRWRERRRRRRKISRRRLPSSNVVDSFPVQHNRSESRASVRDLNWLPPHLSLRLNVLFFLRTITSTSWK